MIILGLILPVIGFVLGVPVLWTIGLILLVIGAILFLFGAIGREVGGGDTGTNVVRRRNAWVAAATATWSA